MFPDLSQVITAADVSTKGTGSYAADYVNWAKVAHLLQVHAQGWQFHLRMSPEGFHVWKAPNGTGYMVGYFINTEGVESADFPQAVMDNRNNPVPFEKITARDVTDTHRRALCAAACFTFGLAYQLWAKEKVEDPQSRDFAESRIISPNQVQRIRSFVQAHGITPEEAKGITKGKPADQVLASDFDSVWDQLNELAIRKNTASEPPVITRAQLDRLFAIANERGLTQEEQVAIVSGQFGFSSRKLITADKYDAVVAAYQATIASAGDGTELLND